MALKQQSAFEFIVAYSWAILIITLFVVTVAILSGAAPPQSYLASSCNIQPLLPCTETLLAYNAITPLQYYIVFSNQLGSILYFPANSINLTTMGIGGTGTTYSLGSCSPSFASESSTVLCIVNIAGTTKPSIGSQAITSFTLSYNFCSSRKLSSCAPGLYKSSGYSVQPVAPSNINLYAVNVVTNPSGTIIINGVTYFNNTIAYFPTGNYLLFAIPAQGLNFASWSISSASSRLSSTTMPNTTLTLTSNALITANFH